MDVCRADFNLVSEWKIERSGPKCVDCGAPLYVIDKATGRRYSNESKLAISLKCASLALLTLPFHALGAIVVVAYRIIKAISRFLPSRKLHHFSARYTAAGKDLAKAVAAPLAVIGLEAAALYGIFRPLNGRKIYATLERATYKDSVLAPSFQPDQSHHRIAR
jgi:hypothetical protein